MNYRAATPLIPITTLAWLFGIWGAWRVALPFIALGFAAGVALLGVILWRRAPRPRWVFVLALAAILGALRYNSVQPHLDQSTLATRSANDQPQSVIVEGIIVGEPDTRDNYANMATGSALKANSRRQTTQASLISASTSLVKMFIQSCRARV